MSDDDSGHKSTGTKVPVFDGSVKNWPCFKTKMASHLARLNLSEILGDGVKDTDDCPGADAPTKEKATKKRVDN